ncbi:MAG: hypothetical protein GY714_20000 [Desulfobacterales bacterium]|nr:hypothetical protein [Desulfobacterales bacterium]
MTFCPKCKKRVKSIKTRYGVRNQCCDLWSWGENVPLETKWTHHARKSAHEEFDKLWKSKLMSRKEAYTWLAKKLDLSKKKCHIKLFNESQCFDVERLSMKKLKRLEGKENGNS